MSEYEDHVQKNAIGLTLKVTCLRTDDGQPYDLTGCTVSIFLKDPNGVTVEKSATAPAPTTGVIEYTTVADDIDAAGWWELQGRIVKTGVDYRTETHKFRVWENL